MLIKLASSPFRVYSYLFRHLASCFCYLFELLISPPKLTSFGHFAIGDMPEGRFSDEKARMPWETKGSRVVLPGWSDIRSAERKSISHLLLLCIHLSLRLWKRSELILALSVIQRRNVCCRNGHSHGETPAKATSVVRHCFAVNNWNGGRSLAAIYSCPHR